MSTRTVLLLRHARTAHNAAGRYISRSDPPLDDVGRDQAAGAGAALAGLDIAAVITSPSRRACQTAEIVARNVEGAPEIRVDRRAAELDLGPFEGQLPEELSEGPTAHEFRAWRSTNSHQTPAGVESVTDVVSRTRSLLLDHTDSPLLVVTHALTARILTADLIGLPVSHFWLLTLEPCRFMVLRWAPRGVRLWQANVQTPRVSGA